MRAPFDVTVGPPPVISAAIHAGHEVRNDLVELIALDDAARLREEDPYTDRLIADLGTQFVVHRSRFEVDLNRPPSQAIYRVPNDAWGLEVWREDLPATAVRDSLAIYEDFYEEFGAHHDRVIGAGPCLVLDVHSYNHRRAGPGEPAAPIAESPEVNVGTGALDRARWGPLVDHFIRSLADQRAAGHRLDVRENVRFRGGHLSHWVTRRDPERSCVLAIEFKKTFMDEWTDVADHGHIDQLAAALRVAVQATVAAMIEHGP